MESYFTHWEETLEDSKLAEKQLLAPSLLDFRRLEFCSWFIDDSVLRWFDRGSGVSCSDICTEDIENWVCNWCFEGRNLSEVRDHGRVDEIEEMEQV